MVRFQDVVFPVAPTTEPQEPVEEEDDEPTWPIQPAFLSADGVAVHVEYDIDNPPPVPGSEWTRFICISDTHSRTFQVPIGDVLLHSGDLTGYGRVKETKKTVDWLRELPHRNKIIIAGNHDMTLHREYFGHDADPTNLDIVEELVKGQESKDSRVTYLQDEKYEFQAKEGGRTWTVWGSPWSVEFGSMAFNYGKDEAEALIGAIPKTDILLTHGPPRGIHDMTTRGECVGCPVLLRHLETIQPRLHVFGHIHESRGASIREWESSGRTASVNAANSPLGPNAWDADNRRLKTGGPGWLPVIVDLRN